MGEWRSNPTILDFSTRCRLIVSFIPRGNSSDTNWIGGWLGPTANLDAVVLRKISCSYWESNLGHPACSLLLYELSYIVSFVCRELTFKSHRQNFTSLVKKGYRLLGCEADGIWTTYAVLYAHTSSSRNMFKYLINMNHLANVAFFLHKTKHLPAFLYLAVLPFLCLAFCSLWVETTVKVTGFIINRLMLLKWNSTHNVTQSQHSTYWASLAPPPPPPTHTQCYGC
jgi:hypothetical protein